jgi:quercetin dioxygenase-like cupin family protein
MKVYDWRRIEPEQMSARIARKVLHGSNVTIARIELQRYAVVPEHSHVHEQVTTIEKGSLKFRMGGKEFVLNAGESLLIPSNEPHAVEALEDTIAVDVFAPVREDWIRGDDAYLRK